MMTEHFSLQSLKRFYQTHPRIENFGPGSQYPCVIIEMISRKTPVDPAIGRWLTTLPCPVIGYLTKTQEPDREIDWPDNLHDTTHPPIARFCDTCVRNKKTLCRITENISRAPYAAMILVQHLRLIENLPLEQAVLAESFAYGTVQTGPDHQKWLDRRASPPPPGRALSQNAAAVITETFDITGGAGRIGSTGGSTGSVLTVTLNRPDIYNAMTIEMRDALWEALEMAQALPEIAHLNLRANGRCFSIGGAVEEFGYIRDATTAHWIRSLRHPAQLLAQLRDRMTLHMDVTGPAIGAGAELAGFGTHIRLAPTAWFQLPELKYGLIPGAGGTASIMARIGRHRTNYMALTMKRITAPIALSWGLADEGLADEGLADEMLTDEEFADQGRGDTKQDQKDVD